MAAPSQIGELVARFQRQAAVYRSGRYNETQTRREFIDPFFEALGWDINNSRGVSEPYKEVIHEDSIKVGGLTKAPDYCFLTGGMRRFFVEAKKPSVHVRSDTSPAFQLRRYGWSARLPLSILTDFEDFAVYDCRIEPIRTDSAMTARVFDVHYLEYIERWDEIAALFSRDAVFNGSLDTFIESKKAEKGVATVDKAFLKEIEAWREALAHNIAIWNKSLTQRDLNFAVQMTIDRIVFLRICEDRGIEPYGRLQALLNGGQVYPRLTALFEQADERYNSGLFHFHSEPYRDESPDELTLSLYIDDEPIKKIIKRLYYPDSPYEFSVMPIEILGQVYEQFLGKLIRIDTNRDVSVEEKPEVRKAGGVYYTPTYIVDYIVKNTIGKLVEGKTPQQIRGDQATKKLKRKDTAQQGNSVSKNPPLSILDPACGSGSFLIGAYQYLLDWYRDWYISDGPENHKDELYQGYAGEWRLSTSERKRILLTHIYGVDIDPQAVEVTKLSLLLKVLEGETAETVAKQLTLFQERALPDLSDNIKCGNSLIESDFYEATQAGLPGQDDHYRINVFDWNIGFQEIMRAGGFDAVIGNPPWISLTGKFGNDIYSDREINYLIARYHGNTYMPNVYEYFVAQGLSLTKPSGYFGFIVPDRLGFNSQFIQLRGRILAETKIVSLIYKAPFPGVTADTLIFIFQKMEASEDHRLVISEYGKPEIQRKQSEFLNDPNYVFEYFESSEIMAVVDKISASPLIAPLSTFCESTSGFGGKSQLIHSEKTSDQQIPTIKGDSIGRYELRKTYWFDFRKEHITGRTTDKRKLGAAPKILLRKTGDSIIATYDDSGIFPEQSLYFLYNQKGAVSFKFLLGVLNSKLLKAYYRAKSLTNKNSIAQVKKVDLDRLPMPNIDLSHPAARSHHDRIVMLVEQMLALHRQRAAVKTNQDRTIIQRQIEAAERQINKLVYELYNLDQADIDVIERNVE